MKLLIATTHRGVIGGTESYLSDLLPALRDEGFSLGLLYDFDNGDRKIDDRCPDLPVWCTSDPRGVDSALAWGPDRCYSQGMFDPKNEERIAEAVPTILFAHGHYANCASGLKCNGWKSIRPCRRQLSLACLGINYWSNCRVRNPLTLLDNFRKQTRRRRLMRKVVKVLIASRYMASEMERHGARGKTVVCPLFIHESFFESPLPSPRPMSHRILFSGRLTDVKGGRTLLEAVALAQTKLARELTVDFAGSGPEEATLKATSATMGIRTRFHGWIDRKALNRLHDESDLLAVPSLWPEPFGLVGIEAGSRGLPAVGFRVGGIPDWLIPGESGELSPSPPTAPGFAEAICRALHDPLRHQSLREGAWRNARRFTRQCHLQTLIHTLNWA